MKRYAAAVTGTVQGVGFRWGVVRLAETLGATGWVRNEPDGSVTLEVQADSPALLRFFEGLPHCARWARVDGVERTRLPLAEGEPGFRVRY